MVILFDAPMAPLYFAAVFLIHPSLGFVTLAAGGAAVRHRRHQPARDVGPARPGQRLRVQGRRAGRCPGAQRPGHQRHGHAQRKHSAMGPRADRRPHQADGRARFELLDQRRLALLSPADPDRHPRLGRLSGAGKPAHRRHDDCRLDHRRPRPAAAGRHDRGLAQRGADLCRLRARQGRRRDPAKGQAEAAPAQAAGPRDGGENPLPAARHEGAGPERRQLRVAAGRDAGDRGAVGLGQIHARAHPRRLPAADRRQGSARRHRAAQLGPAPVRRVHRLSAPGSRAVSGLDQGQRLPHAPRPAGRHHLQRRGDIGRARHDLPASERV